MTDILITGGSGFFGRHFAQRCLELPHAFNRVVLLARGEHRQAEAADWLKPFDPHSRLRHFIGDVRDPVRLNRAFRGVDIVVHAAALKRIEVGNYDPEELVLTNVMGSMNVVQACRDQNVSKAVLVSSDKAYQPVSPYGQSKAMAECIFLAANNSSGGKPIFSVCRYGNVAGSTGSVIPRWLSGNVSITDPDCTRFWMRIEQAVDLVLHTIRTMKGGELNIPDLPAFTLRDLAHAMGLVLPKPTGLPAWEKKHESMDETRCSYTAPRMGIEDLRRELEGVNADIGCQRRIPDSANADKASAYNKLGRGGDGGHIYDDSRTGPGDPLGLSGGLDPRWRRGTDVGSTVGD